ncbi:MAG: Chaperone protein HtpG [Chlamydiia bacterium]|nr:Chaperone protein HtpG [Chlamydiia bacterium]
MPKGTLKIHSENILPILKQWLYSDKDIFLRELISNSCDAISKIKILREEGKAECTDCDFRIDIAIDKENKTLTISDNGIGMSAEEVKTYIAQLAFSGAEEFVKKYQSKDESEQIIGHFGLGFYSSFMVSNSVEIDTKSFKEEEAAAHWSCDGSSEYNMKKGKRESRGTTITLHIGEDSQEYLEEEKVKEILGKYCSFLPFPIHVGESQINKNEPLWLKNPADCTDEEYLAFYRQLYPMDPPPIFWIHINVDYPFHLKGILFFPKITQRFDFQKSAMMLFCNRVFVSSDCKDLLPEHLMVLRGAIDSPDIPLNVSRSYLQTNRTVRQVGAHISKKVSDRLVALSNQDKEKFEQTWPDIEMIVKLGCIQDEKFYDKVKDVLMWKNISDEWTTFTNYLSAHKEAYGGKVYYTLPEKSGSDFLSLYKEKGIEVLTTHGPLDTSLFNFLEGKNEGVKFQRIDGGIDDLILDEERKSDDLSTQIAGYVKEALGIETLEVEAKSLASDSLPAFVMINEEMRRMKEYLSMTQGNLGSMPFDKHTLVVNINNPLINSLYKLKESKPELAKSMALHVYELSLLGQKELPPEKISEFISRSNKVMEELAAN